MTKKEENEVKALLKKYVILSTCLGVIMGFAFGIFW